MSLCFSGKTVIITGSSSGIGASVAVGFAKLGANLIITGRNVNQLHLVKKQCVESGLNENQVVFLAGNITDESFQRQLIQTALNIFKQIDVLVNNAGMVKIQPAFEITMKEYDRTLDVNLRSAVSLSLMALPHLIKTKGNIVNVSSISGLNPWPGELSYCVSKAGMDMMTKSLAFEMAAYGVRVNSVNPGGVATNIHREHYKTPEEKELLIAEIAKIHPLGRRMGEVKEISDAIIFLASKEASFVTGQLLAVDGGCTINGINF